MSDVANISEKQEKAVINNSTSEEATPNVEKSLKPAVETSPKVEKKTPSKRTPSKRMSFIERAQKESEELVKTMGGSLELGGRRTRSSARGTPTKSIVETSPPPSKKARESPIAATKTTPARQRGRGRKLDTNEEPEDKALHPAATSNKQVAAGDVTPSKQSTVAATIATPPQIEPAPATTNKNIDSEESSVENAENSVVDAANTAAAAEEASLNATAEKAANSANAEKAEDKPDATLETIPEEQQNHVEDIVEKTKKQVDEPTKSDTLMETDVQPQAKTIKLVDAKETKLSSVIDVDKETAVATPTTKTTTEPKPTVVAEKKEPTPEPMEIDSSTTSNDGIEIIEETTPKRNEDAAAAKENDIDSSKNNSNANVVIDVDEIQSPKNLSPAIELLDDENDAVVDVAPSAAECVKKVPLPTEVAKNVDANTNVVKPTKITGDSQKTDNNFCEPKIVSPPITAASDSAVSTPQFCN